MIITPAPVKAIDMLPETKTVHDLKMLDNATLRDALLIAQRTLTNDQKNTVISCEITAHGITRTARVSLAEFIESALVINL